MPRVFARITLVSFISLSGCRDAADTQRSEPDAVTSASVRDGGTDPCALLERSEIEPAFGAVLHEGRRMGRSCKWKPESGPGYFVLQLELRNGQSIYDFARRAARADAELPGIGDQAFRSGLTVGVRLGDRFLSLVLSPNQPSKAELPPELIALAKRAIRRLPPSAPRTRVLL